MEACEQPGRSTKPIDNLRWDGYARESTSTRGNNYGARI